MPVVYLAPDPVQSTFLIPGGNSPGVGVQLFCYQAGSTTLQSAYTDNTGNATHTNPIVLDSGGNIPNGGSVWIPTGQPAKFVWAPANDSNPPVSPYKTIDNVSGVNDITSVEWVSGPTPTFVNSSTFTLTGDQTGSFKKGRKLKFSVTAGTVYGAVGLAAFATSTTINPVFSSGSLDSGLTGVSYSLVDVDPSSISGDYIHKKATAVPSASTTDLWAIDGDFVHVTGVTTIGGFSTAPYAGSERDVIFDSALTLIHGGNLQVPGAANVSTAAGDRAKVRADFTSTAVITFYQKAAETPNSPVMTFLGSTAIVATSTNIAVSWSTTYTRLRAFYSNMVPTNNGQDLWVRLSGDGVNYDAGATSYFSAILAFRGGATSGKQGNGTTFAYAGLNTETTATFGVSGVIDFPYAAIASSSKAFFGCGSGREPPSSSQTFQFGGNWANGTSTPRGIRLLFESGSTAAGRLAVFGMNDF